jgi:hypothetical protein
MWRKWAIRVAAVLAVPVAIVLVLVAIDVLRAPAQLRGDDLRFQIRPHRQAGLYDDLSYLPGDPATHLLGLGDDVGYRHTIEDFVRVRPPVQIYGPVLENLFGKVQYELAAGSANDPDPKRRSILLNLAGAMTLATFSSDPTENANNLRKAIADFRTAIDLDSTNTDAKINLELALRNAKAANIPGTGPDSGASQGKVSGQGRSGTGY